MLAWRKRLGYDGPLLSALTRLFVKTVLEFYGERDGGGILRPRPDRSTPA